MAILISINVSLFTGKDGLDGDSKLIIVLHPIGDCTRAAERTFQGDDEIIPKQTIEFDLTLNTNTLTKAQMHNNYLMDVFLISDGRHHYEGTMRCQFNFDDGSDEELVLEDFKIGTYEEPNQSGKVVSFTVT